MQILIEIPEGTKRAIDMGIINQVLTFKVWTAIKNGTPLPEHHERLVSVDDVDDAIYDFSRGVCVDYGQIMEYIEHVPTIIPATKEGDEG